MAEVYKLPASSYEELIKIIIAYGRGKVGVSVSLDDLVISSGIGRSIISRNNGFLIQVGLITEGTKKSPTDMCRKLANSYLMGLKEQTSSLWKEICEKDEFIFRIISMVGIKRKISKPELISHIVYSANRGNGIHYRVGAGTLVEIMKTIGAIAENEGNIVICDTYSNDIDNSDEITAISSTVTLPNVDKKEEDRENTFYVQQYTCESGKIAKMIIPEDATEDDLLGFKDMLSISLKRKFKIEIE